MARGFYLSPLVGLALVTQVAVGQEQLAIKGGRVIPIAGNPIDGGVVLIRDGKILAVGKDLAIPTEARVIDATGKVVLPGFIEAHSERGMDQTNERNPVVPFLSVIDAIDPSQDYFEECRRNGVTTVAVVPGDNTMIGGQAAVIKTAGGFVDQMIVKRKAGIKISLRPSGERSRMSHLAALRKELDAARDYVQQQQERQKTARPAKAEPPRTDGAAEEETAADEQPEPQPAEGQEGPTGPQQIDAAALQRETLAQLIRGELPAYLYCELAMDVPQALKLVKEYKLKAILVLAPPCYKAVKQVADSKLPVILEPTLVYWETDPRTGADRKIIIPKVYREAGVPVTFQVGGMESGTLFRAANLPPTLGTNYLWYQAATAVKYGTPVSEALEALTLRPARLLGVESVAGSIEPGKDADLVILSGDPLKLDTWVEATLVRGQVVYERSKDRKLKALLQPSKESVTSR